MITNIDELLVKRESSKDWITSYEDAIAENQFLSRNLNLSWGGDDEGCDILPSTGEQVDSLIRFWNKEDDENNLPIEKRIPIKIWIDCNGGDLDATFTMVDAIRVSKTPIWTINIGKAYSGGFFTFIAGHRRIAYPHSKFLYHEGSTGYVGDANKFQNFASFYKDIYMKQLKELVLSTTKFSEDFYESIRRDDYWMTAEDALRLGVADEISNSIIN